MQLIQLDFSFYVCYTIIFQIFPSQSIQATLAPPATGKMVKGLSMCYTVIFFTFYSAAVSGYWVFGNKSNSIILKSLMPDEGPSLAPVPVLGLAVIFVLLQLLAIGLVKINAITLLISLPHRIDFHISILQTFL